MSMIVQVRKIQRCGVVGLAVHGAKLGRNGRLSLMQVNVTSTPLPWDKIFRTYSHVCNIGYTSVK